MNTPRPAPSRETFVHAGPATRPTSTPATLLLLLIGRRPKRQLATRGRIGDEPEVLSSALGLDERLLKPMLGVPALVERSDLAIAEAGIQTASFDEVGAGVQTQHVQPAISGRGLERLHETYP